MHAHASAKLDVARFMYVWVRRWYNEFMERRDRDGEIFEDDLTENESEPDGPERDDVAHTLKLDPQVDSQDSDRTMADNRFGQNNTKRP
jgi:hypothetical protein